MTPETVVNDVPVGQLYPSPSNPRKTFDQASLEELASSIREKGILEPLLVRAHPNGAPPAFEVVAGERRFRAAQLAELETAPCIVRHLTDLEVLEIQTIENLQRDDVHPLEEADGYAALMKAGAYDEARIAERIGKTKQYVYDRVQLVNLVPRLREVFLRGEIGVGHAIILARQSASDQEFILGAPRSSDFNGLFRPVQGHLQERLGVEGRRNRKPVSVRELQTFIDDHVRFRPEQVDLPNLFPETFEALGAAKEEELKVVKITRDYQLKPETREKGERTYTVRSWKRADGRVEPAAQWEEKGQPSKECEHSVMGVVVTGPGRGDAFRVCIAKKKCTVHWSKEQKEAKRRAEGGASTADSDRYAEASRKRDERWKKEQEDRERWRAAAPLIIEAALQAVQKAPLGKLAPILWYELTRTNKRPPKIGSWEDMVRELASKVMADNISQPYRSEQTKRALKKHFGINATKIVNEASPREKPAKKKPAKKKAKKAVSPG